MQLPLIHQPGHDANLVISQKNSLALQLGEIVQAEVMTVTETAVAIRMKSRILEARTNVPLREGETITLVVEGRGDETRLRLLQGGGGAGSIKNSLLSALHALQGLRPAAEDMKALNALLGGIPQTLKDSVPGLNALEKLLTSLDGLSGEVLKNAVRNSGVLLETKLRLLLMRDGTEGAAVDGNPRLLAEGDLKAALLSISRALGDVDMRNRLFQGGVKAEMLQSVVDNLLKNMEAFQLQSRLSDTLQVFLPFVWNDLKEGELLFRESDREQSGERAYSCTLNLDLERAGKLSARVLLQSGLIHAEVIVENSRFCSLLREGALVLRRGFETAGIRLGNLTVRHQRDLDFKMSQAGRLDLLI